MFATRQFLSIWVSALPAAVSNVFGSVVLHLFLGDLQQSFLHIFLEMLSHTICHLVGHRHLKPDTFMKTLSDHLNPFPSNSFHIDPCLCQMLWSIKIYHLLGYCGFQPFSMVVSDSWLQLHSIMYTEATLVSKIKLMLRENGIHCSTSKKKSSPLS